MSTSEDDLEWILNELQALAWKLNGDRRREAELAYNSAANHLNELKRLLNYIKSQNNLGQSEVSELWGGFKDLEKWTDSEQLGKQITL